MDTSIAEQSAELITYPGYIAILEGLRAEIEYSQENLLTADDPQQILRIVRHWQVLQRIYEVLSTRPEQIREELLQARQLPIHEAFLGRMNQYKDDE